MLQNVSCNISKKKSEKKIWENEIDLQYTYIKYTGKIFYFILKVYVKYQINSEVLYNTLCGHLFS